ncbi:hypothetical protein U472_00875 [Orenia metallireducens]|uniref:Uncharacterized protein n=1 Tax=Orenia metallireducens TaxID=1413210 RepID=A0A1C0ACY1_9FIRM|nr:hypothetical protein [Orenia metallireducens]OCL28472.1 hypothetical protein U472_00875 [Orenia metallireducens]
MELSLIKIILVVLPESLLFSYVSLGLIGIKTKVINHFKITIFFTFFLVIVRNILGLYGLHVILGALFLSLVLKVIVKIDWNMALIATLLIYILSFLGEIIVAEILSYWNFEAVDFISGDSLSKFLTFFYLSRVPLVIAAIKIYWGEVNLLKI